MMNLKETVDSMLSQDYKERFKAEYWQTLIRYEKLHSMIIKYNAGTLSFKPTCPVTILEHQVGMMGAYLKDLEVRAEIEGIDLCREVIYNGDLEPVSAKEDSRK